VVQGGAIVTCDNGFTLYLNGRQIKKGTEWSRPEGVALRGLLTKGKNTIVFVASNAGSGPNAAGLFFEARVKLENGEEMIVASDDSWQWNASVPQTKEGRLGRVAGEWNTVAVIPALGVWTAAVDSAGRNLLAQAMNGDLRMVRASLMKNDFLMRSLGRPFREQIVSMRPAELTTLEAVDLSNGSTLAGYLSRGATFLTQQSGGDNNAMISRLYEFALSRQPSNDEQLVLINSLSTPATTQEVEDVLWAIFMMPEFFLVR
jgi:hypothetical protein